MRQSGPPVISISRTGVSASAESKSSSQSRLALLCTTNSISFLQM